jgi:hypothetical protein
MSRTKETIKTTVKRTGLLLPPALGIAGEAARFRLLLGDRERAIASRKLNPVRRRHGGRQPHAPARCGDERRDAFAFLFTVHIHGLPDRFFGLQIS